MADTEDRVTELEIKLSHQDILIEDLRQALGQHHEAIELIRKQLQVLLDRGDGTKPVNERPPHY